LCGYVGNVRIFNAFRTFTVQVVQERRGLSNKSGNSGYTRLGDTGAAILQRAGELSSSTTENQL
jgi:hypothetical protein